jgi:peptidoglycan/LPS O-acetylase OafA/YrhL
MATLGKYSYALYLFHNPIQVAMRETPLSPPRLAAAGLGTLGGQAAFCVLASAAALACAWLSWHLFEEPILRLKRFFPSGDRGASAPPRPVLAAGAEVAR